MYSTIHTPLIFTVRVRTASATARSAKAHRGAHADRKIESRNGGDSLSLLSGGPPDTVLEPRRVMGRVGVFTI
jgi:hypothetical protein